MSEAALRTTEVRDGGMVAAFTAPSDGGRHPALLVLSGSEGGSKDVRALAQPFAQQGYAVLALSYFAADGLPPTLEEVPLEYFERAVDWLAAHPSVDPDRLGVYGVSKGAEAAMLLASRSPRLRAVGAGMPSHVVWPGVAAGRTSTRSSWSAAGRPLPHLPYDTSRPFDLADWLGSVHRMYDGALPSTSKHPAAVIPVERINGPVLLISGEDDRLSPSSKMGEAVIDRLNASGFPFAREHLAYAEAGHAVGVPPSLGRSERGPDEAVGGTAAGNAAARAGMWPKLLCFFDRALAAGKPKAPRR